MKYKYNSLYHLHRDVGEMGVIGSIASSVDEDKKVVSLSCSDAIIDIPFSFFENIGYWYDKSSNPKYIVLDCNKMGLPEFRDLVYTLTSNINHILSNYCLAENRFGLDEIIQEKTRNGFYGQNLGHVDVHRASSRKLNRFTDSVTYEYIVIQIDSRPIWMMKMTSEEYQNNREYIMDEKHRTEVFDGDALYRHISRHLPGGSFCRSWFTNYRKGLEKDMPYFLRYISLSGMFCPYDNFEERIKGYDEYKSKVGSISGNACTYHSGGLLANLCVAQGGNGASNSQAYQVASSKKEIYKYAYIFKSVPDRERLSCSENLFKPFTRECYVPKDILLPVHECLDFYYKLKKKNYIL